MPKKNTSAVIAFIIWSVCSLLFLFALPLSYTLNIDMKSLLKKEPWFVMVINGVYLIATGLLILIFRNAVGLWSSQLKTWVGARFPLWGKMSGLPEEKVQDYLSLEFNRRMALIAALVLIVTGITLSASFLFMNY